MTKIIISIFIFLLASTNLQAKELLMFDNSSCGWCQLWHKEVGSSYSTTDEGKVAPLRILHISKQSEISGLRSSIRGTPTFVIMSDDNKEMRRILGYQGKHEFFLELCKYLETCK